MSIRALKPLYELQQRQRFLPDWRGVFVNPYYILRKALFRSVKEHAALLTGRLLDLGCGISPYRTVLRAAGEYVRMDIQFLHDEREDIVFYDGQHIPSDDEMFDSLLCTEVLEHVADLESAASEMYRVLRPGGHALLTMPFMWEEHGYPNDYRRLTLSGAEDVFTSKGFEVLLARKIGRFTASFTQLLSNELMKLCPIEHALGQLLFCSLVISPLTILGLLGSSTFPGSASFYLGICLCLRKPATRSLLSSQGFNQAWPARASVNPQDAQAV